MSRRIIIALILSLFPVLSMGQERFNSDNSRRDFRAEYGLKGPFSGSSLSSTYIEADYTRRFLGPLEWKAGGRLLFDGIGYQRHVEMPLAVAYRTGTTSFQEAVVDVAIDATERLIWGEKPWASLLYLLFRRTEFFIGITPGLYMGDPSESLEIEPLSRFSLTGDLGLCWSIPIWRFAINVTPALHYSFINNYNINGQPVRSWFSIAGGIGFIF